jgi:hypothetical protein
VPENPTGRRAERRVNARRPTLFQKTLTPVTTGERKAILATTCSNNIVQRNDDLVHPTKSILAKQVVLRSLAHDLECSVHTLRDQVSDLESSIAVFWGLIELREDALTELEGDR